MKKPKIKITENQLKVVLKENFDPLYDNLFKQDVKFEISGFKNNKKYDIGDINTYNLPIYFKINFEKRSYGYKDIYIESIKGPETLDIELQIINLETDEEIVKPLNLNLNWSRAILEKSYDNTHIGLDNEGEIVLSIDNGKIVVSEIKLYFSKSIN